MSAAVQKKASAPARDAEATKSRILDAAEEEFARGGLLGARTEAIAANTGVTKAMIYYYFRDKEGLYQAVLERAVSRRVRAMQKVDIHGCEPKVALRDLIGAFIDEAAVNQRLPAIFMYEGLQNQGRFYGQISIASVYGPIVEVLERGVAAGQFRQLDPLHAAINIVGMCVHYFCSAPNIKYLFPAGTDIYGAEMVSRHKAEAVHQIVNSVLASCAS